MAEPPQPHRRSERHPRRLLVHTVRLTDALHAGALALGRTLNLSAGGARVVLEEPLPVGTSLDITLQLGDLLLDVGAEVVYCEPGEERGHAVGVEFTDLTEEDRRTLERHIEPVPESG